MLIKQQRFLGNTHTLEMHDTQNQSTNCELDEISITHRRWYASLAAAKADLTYDRPYDNCAWCLGDSRR